MQQGGHKVQPAPRQSMGRLSTAHLARSCLRRVHCALAAKHAQHCCVVCVCDNEPACTQNTQHQPSTPSTLNTQAPKQVRQPPANARQRGNAPSRAGGATAQQKRSSRRAPPQNPFMRHPSCAPPSFLPAFPPCPLAPVTPCRSLGTQAPSAAAPRSGAAPPRPRWAG